VPAPLAHGAAFLVVGALAGAALAISVRGMHPGFAITGLFAIAYLLGIGYGAPKIGIALFVAGVTAGQLAGAVAFDHAGAFGLDVHSISASRVLGLALVLAGVVVVRFGP
jgi:transporter family-2 protein